MVYDDVLEAKICGSVVTNYDGAFDEGNQYYHGEGMTALDNDSKFTGEYHNGLFEGNGSFRWSNGVIYSGDFKRGHSQGVGEYTWPDGSTYSGDIEFYKRQGNGVFKGGSGQVYQGTWKNGLRDGTGTLFYDEAQTVSYKGEWQKGMRHGYGVMTYASGNAYEGEWKNDKKCGEGVILWQDRNEIYIGQWENDLANGEGEHIWVEVPQKAIQRQTCNLYRGAFKDGKRCGHGTFFYANGSQYTGQWLNNSKHGLGCFVHPDGRIHFGNFEMDRMVLLTNESKESEAVTTQYKLNVTEFLGSLPAVEKAPSFYQQTLDVERLLLRYNTSIRVLLQKYTTAAADISAIHKSLEKLTNNQRQLHPSMQPPPEWTKNELLFHTRRDIHSRFFTIRLRQLCQFARECDIIGPTMTSFDVCNCVKNMHIDHNAALNTKAKAFYDQVHIMREAVRRMEEPPMDDQVESETESGVKDSTVVSPPPVPPVEVDPELLRAVEGVDILNVPSFELPALLNYTFERDIYTDMQFPIRDREFVEVFTRIVAEASSRKHSGGVSGSGLFDNVYRMLAETMEPLSTEARPVSVFVSALYSEEVQTILLKQEGSVRRLWDQVLEIAASAEQPSAPASPIPTASRMLSARCDSGTFFTDEGTCRPRVKHVVKLFMALKGSAVSEEGCTVLGVLEALNKKGQSGDFSSLDLEVCFDDFIELFCRLVVSNLWIFEPEERAESSQQGSLSGAVQKEPGNGPSIVQAALVQRLSDWLPLI